MKQVWIRILVVLTGVSLLIFSFQNCSRFSPQDQVLVQQSLFESQSALDATYLPDLLKEENISLWSKPEMPQYIKKDIYSDQWSFILASDRNVSGTLLAINSGTGIEETSVSVVNGKIRALRRNTSGGAWSEYLETSLPQSGDKMVIAVSFGMKASEILLMVNGVLQSGSLVKAGAAQNFSYMMKQVTSQPSSGKVYEYIVYASDSSLGENVLSPEELNVMSRYIANNELIPNVILDPAFLNSTPSTEPTVNPKFVLAKAIYDGKCIGCHKAGGDSPNLVGLTQEKAVTNGWVVPGNPTGSKLYYRLKGSSGAGTKNMPAGGGSISASEVQTIADWINSIQ